MQPTYITNPPPHLVQFFESDEFLTGAIAQYVESGVKRRDGIFVIATPEHRETVCQLLAARGINLGALIETGQLVLLDAAETLSSFIVEGQPSHDKFNQNVFSLIRNAQARFTHVRAYGEMVGLLFAENNVSATIELEKIWHALVAKYSFSLFCGYSLTAFNNTSHAQAFSEICESHSHVLPSETYINLSSSADRNREIALLQQKAQSLESELEKRRQSESFQKLILDSSRDCIKVIDLNSKILFVNKGAFKLMGICNESEVIGKSWLGFWQDENLIVAGKALEAAKNGNVAECTNSIQVGDEIKSWHITLNPIYDEKRNISKVLVVSRDVTAAKQAEVAVIESEKQFRTLADSIPHLAWMAKADGYVFWYNRRWYEYTGMTPDQMDGWDWQSLHDPSQLAAVAQRWNESIQTGSSFEMEFPLKGTDGKFRTFLTRINPVRDSQGTIVRWFGTNTEIEEQKRSRETLQTLNQVGQLISAELDLNKLVQSVTDAATKLTRAEFGAFFYNVVGEKGEAYTLYTLSGAPIEAFSKFPMPRKTEIFKPTFEGAGILRSDDITKDQRFGKNAPYFGMPVGHLPVVSYLAVPVISRSGEVLGGLFFGHSKTGVFTKTEEELAMGLAAQAAIAIDNAKLFQKTQEAIRVRDEFLSIASHELKTPLTPLKLQIQNLKRFVASGTLSSLSPEKLKKIAETSDRQIDRISTLIDDLLDVTRITAGKFGLNREEVDLVEIIREALDRYGPQLATAECGIELSAPDKAYGHWDKLRVEQVVINLLTNAIKYAPKTLIQISVTLEEGKAVFTVKDQGVGISEEDQKRVFDRFERVKSVNNIGGLGLGLFITRQIVEAHGGKIDLESTVGRGSSFIVVLPLQQEQSA